MKSFSNYNSNNELFNYITEAQLIKENGSTIDSIFNKFDRYNKLISNDSINESIYFPSKSQNDVLFNTQEQLVAQKMLINVVENYAIALMEEEGLINESFIYESVFDSIAKFAKEKTQSVKKGLNNIADKFKKLYSFLNELVKKGIKSVKEMFWKLTDMMLSLGCKFEELVAKLKMDKQKAMSALLEKIKGLFKRVQSNDAEVKTNVYEALTNYTEYSKEFITEAENNDDKSDDKSDKAEDNGENKKEGKSWGGILGDAAKSILIQMFAYYAVTLLLPAIITLIAGPIAGKIAESLAKIIWSSGVVFKQAKAEYNLHKSGEFNKKYNTKWKKFFHYTFFFFNICWAAWKAIKGAMEMGDTISALASGNENLIKSLLPSEGVQSVTKFLNKGWKAITGHNASGFDQLQEHIAHVENGIIEEVKELVKGTEHKGLTDEQIKAEFENNHFKSSMEAINHFKDKGLISSVDELKNLTGNGSSAVILDGCYDASKNGWSSDILKAWQEWGGKPEDLAKIMKQGYNATLNAANSNAGSMAVFNFPNDFLRFCGSHGVSLGNGGHFSVLGSETTVNLLKSVFKHVAVLPIQNTMDWFGGLFPWGKSKHVEDTVEPAPVVVEDGEGFRVRLGSENDKDNFIYEIGKGGVKREKMTDATSKIKDKNGSLIEKINGYFTDIKKSLNEKLEHTDNEDDKKKFNDHLKEIETLIKDQEVTIFYGKRVEIEEKNENGHISLNDYLIFEGITNDNIKNSLSNIIDYLRQKSSNLGRSNGSGDKNKKSSTQNIQFNLETLLKGKDLSNYLKGNLKEEHLYRPCAAKLQAEGLFKDIKTDELAATLKEIRYLYLNAKKAEDAENNDASKEIKALYMKVIKTLEQDKSFTNDAKKTSTGDKGKGNVDYITFEVKDDSLSDKPHKKAKEIIDVTPDDDDKKELEKIIPPTEPENTDDNDKDNDNENDTEEDTEEDTDEVSDEEVPVLVWSPIFLIGCDLANATKDGPRNDVFTMKNMYENYQYLTFDGGLSEAGIEKFLGEEIIANAIGETYNVSVNKPCIKENDTYKVNTDDGIEADKEREDFGKFTNNEITEILNDKSKGKNYLKGSTSGKISKSDKKKIDATKAKIKQTIKDNDKLKDYCKNSKTLKNVVDEDGNIDETELDNVSTAVTQEQAKENKGFWARVKNFFKSLFNGGSSSDSDGGAPKYDDSEIKELLKQIKELLEEQKEKNNNEVKESLTDTTLFNKQMCRISLQDYILNNTK